MIESFQFRFVVSWNIKEFCINFSWYFSFIISVWGIGLFIAKNECCERSQVCCQFAYLIFFHFKANLCLFKSRFCCYEWFFFTVYHLPILPIYASFVDLEKIRSQFDRFLSQLLEHYNQCWQTSSCCWWACSDRGV